MLSGVSLRPNLFPLFPGPHGSGPGLRHTSRTVPMAFQLTPRLAVTGASEVRAEAKWKPLCSARPLWKRNYSDTMLACPPLQCVCHPLPCPAIEVLAANSHASLCVVRLKLESEALATKQHRILGLQVGVNFAWARLSPSPSGLLAAQTHAVPRCNPPPFHAAA